MTNPNFLQNLLFLVQLKGQHGQEGKPNTVKHCYSEHAYNEMTLKAK